MMSALPDAFRGFSQAAAPVVVTALWQGAILACGLAVCLRLAPRVPAAHRFAIWAAGFAVVVGLPALPILWARIAGVGGAAGTSSFGSGSGASGALLRLDLRWSLVIGTVWIAASIMRAVDLGVHSLRLRRLWKSARVVEVVLSRVPKCEGSPPHGRGPVRGDPGPGAPPFEICTTTELDRPSVIGFFAPRILIPEWLFARLTPEELEQVVLHESEHLRRHDDWTNLIQKLCLVVFPLNLALAWMERRLCREREMACDDGVVRATQAPRAYAACLASLAERGLERRAEALSLGAWQRRPELVERVHRILKRTPGLSPMAATAVMGALGCGLVFGSIEFARCPQLVAFVPVVRVTAQQNAAAGLGDARYTDTSFVSDERRGNGVGFRAVNAVAHMPVRNVHPEIVNGRVQRLATDPRNAGPSTSPSLRSGFAQDDSKLRVEAATSDSGVDYLNVSGKPVQQWIVFTAWEQVESSSSEQNQASNQAAGVRQDYDSSPNAEQETSDGKTQIGETNSSATGKITVTRLIFRIYPASSVSGSDSTSSADQPAIVPLRDGWFVFQL
jgi:hypothetical protein